MASKKSEPEPTTEPQPEPVEPNPEIEERKRRKTEATTVVGDESFPPQGMDLPDGGVVPHQEPENA